MGTEDTRKEGGLKVITEKMMPAMEKAHKEHVLVYGEENKLRLTGLHETAKISEFSYKEGHRGTSVRIPVGTMEAGKGYFEDRRPAGDIDPYLVSAIIRDTTILDGTFRNDLMNEYKSYAKTRGYSTDFV